MKVAAWSFQWFSPAHPVLKTPIFSVYVPRARFDGTFQDRLNVLVAFAENDWLSQYVW